MSKKKEHSLDLEAMRAGYRQMLADVKDQLEAGMYSDSIRTLMRDQQAHIEKRLQELDGGEAE